MTKPKYPLFSSVLSRALERRGEVDRAYLATSLGMKTEVMFNLWLSGHALPRLTALPHIAIAVEIPHEDLLLPWLADTAPDNTQRYHLLAAQIMGPFAANDLFIGTRVNSDRPWFDIAGPPASAAALMAEGEYDFPGVWRDWEA